jgi:hypothetical protein
LIPPALADLACNLKDWEPLAEKVLFRPAEGGPMLRVTGAPADGVVPVRLYGRNPGRDTWSALAAATLSPERGASTIELPAAPMAGYKIEADRRTAGFSAAPRVELLFDPVELLVALSGTPPYRMAVGQPGARPKFLTLTEIAPADASVDLARLPRATVASSDEPPPTIPVQGQAADGTQDMRKLVLWTALLLGTLVVACAAFRLVRSSRS